MISTTEIDNVLCVLETIYALSNSTVAQTLDKQPKFGVLCKEKMVKTQSTFLKKALIANSLLFEKDGRYLWSQVKAAPCKAMAELIIKKAREYACQAAKESYARTHAAKETAQPTVNQSIKELTDKQLISELRSRGWNVTATKSL